MPVWSINMWSSCFHLSFHLPVHQPAKWSGNAVCFVISSYLLLILSDTIRYPNYLTYFITQFMEHELSIRSIFLSWTGSQNFKLNNHVLILFTTRLSWCPRCHYSFISQPALSICSVATKPILKKISCNTMCAPSISFDPNHENVLRIIILMNLVNT